MFERVDPIDLFINDAGRLRSGWRLSVFVLAYMLVTLLLIGLLQLTLALALPREAAMRLLDSNWGFVFQGFILLIPATLIGWGCNYYLEDLPRRALGWVLHRGWLRDLLAGTLVGAASLALAACFCAAAGALSFNLTREALWSDVAETLLLSAAIFLLGAAAEEATFRGYPLQTMLRALPLWVAVIPSSLLFAAVHLYNPNVPPVAAFLNTTLAGVWMAVGYARTRSLWFPLGLHWSWNWMMGSVLGLPVSGITSFTEAPLMRATDAGPAWVTGGNYGIEGGVACTLALLVSTAFIWRTRLLDAPADLKSMTDAENPAPRDASLNLRFETDAERKEH
jgi:membrane protease YdiL (CAAX protease family)